MTTYDEYLNQVKALHKVTANSVLKRLYELLKIEDPLMSKDDMYDRIMKDCLEIWQKQTIRNNMPDELKDQERQETGKKGAERKKEITVTANGSVATNSVANNSPESPTEPEYKTLRTEDEIVKELQERSKSTKPESNRERKLSPIESLAAVKAGATEKQDIFEHNSSLAGLGERIEELELANGRLQEQVKEEKERNQELVKSLNAAAEIKQQQTKQQSPATTTLEYKTLLSEKNQLQDRIDELEALVKKDPKLGFQNATTMQRESNDITTITTTIPNEVEFPAKDLHTFFMDQRYADKIMYIKIEGNQVVGWETDKARLKKREAAKQSGS